MGEIKIKSITVPIKSDQESKTSNSNESNIEDSIKALGDEFDSMSKAFKVKTIGDSKK